MWPKYLPLAPLAYNTYSNPNLASCSPYELVFSRKPKLLLDLETYPSIMVPATFKDYYTLLNKRLQYVNVDFSSYFSICNLIFSHLQD